jgi:ubiquinone biosynthesis protein UbiJ
MIAAPLAAFVNHLLAPEAWARDRLAPFAGKRICINAAPLPDLALRVRAGGLLEAAPAAEFDLTVTVTPAALPSVLRRDASALQAMTFTGDAELAAALQFLLRNLRWDVEEDLSRAIGDVAAHRLAQTARDFLAWQKEAVERLGANVAEYLTEEAAVLAARADLAQFGREVAALADAVARLEKRVDRLAAE